METILIIQTVNDLILKNIELVIDKLRNKYNYIIVLLIALIVLLIIALLSCLGFLKNYVATLLILLTSKWIYKHRRIISQKILFDTEKIISAIDIIMNEIDDKKQVTPIIRNIVTFIREFELVLQGYRMYHNYKFHKIY